MAKVLIEESKERTPDDQLGDEMANLEIFEDHTRLVEVLEGIENKQTELQVFRDSLHTEFAFEPNDAEDEAFRVLNDGLAAYYEQVEKAFYADAIDRLNEQASVGMVYRNNDRGGWSLGDDHGIEEHDGGPVRTSDDDPTEAIYVTDHGNVEFWYWDGDKWVEKWSVV